MGWDEAAPDMTAAEFGQKLLTYPGLDDKAFDNALIGQALDRAGGVPVPPDTPEFTIELPGGQEFTLVIRKKTREGRS